MEEGVVFATGKVDPLGYADSSSWNGGAGCYRACVTFERECEPSVFF